MYNYVLLIGDAGNEAALLPYSEVLYLLIDFMVPRQPVKGVPKPLYLEDVAPARLTLLGPGKLYFSRQSRK